MNDHELHAGRGGVPLRLFGAPGWNDGAKAFAFAPERRFQLLALLAMRTGEWVSRDKAAALLWPEHTLSEARRNLRHVLFKARAAIGGEGLDVNERALRWRVATDVRQFHLAMATDRPADAVALRGGPLLEGLESAASADFTEWLQSERSRLDGMWHGAAVEQLAVLSARPTERAALAVRMLSIDPCDEAAAAALIELELAQGNLTGAERHYREFAARLAEMHAVEPSHRVRDLLRRGGAVASITERRPDTALVGRRIELAELAQLLDRPEQRLVTLTGPGGVGKSSLARQVQAAASVPSTWVELQDLVDCEGAVARIAQGLGVELRAPGDAVAQIARALGDQRRMLVLDNAEHLTGLPSVVERLLAAAAGLVVLVTSRKRLDLSGETVFPVAGLATPDEDSRDAEAASAFDAVRLFDARARAAQHGFVLQDHIASVIEIVEAVGGSPLAIGLAASWVRLLPAEAIARDLRSSIDVLERDPAAWDLPSRPDHASMRAVLDGSWALLAPGEREALEALSVFQGGFSHAAAREVAGVPLPLLSSLVDKSMLSGEQSARFGMHPLIAADARARASLDPTGLAARRERHARHFAHRLTEAAGAQAGDHRAVVDLLRSELANCELAWRHAIANRRAELLQLAVPAWRRYFVATGRFADGSRHFEQALTVPAGESTAPALTAVRAALAWFAKSSGDAEAALSIAGVVLASAVELGDAALTADSLNTLGAAELLRGQWAQARQWFERSLHHAGEHALRREKASALNNLGLTSLCEGSFAGCVDRFTAAAAIQREMGDHVSLARSLHNLASAHMGRGDWALARDANELALRYARAHRVDALTSTIEFMLGATLIELGQIEAAQRHLESAAAGCRARGDDFYEFKARYYLARLASRSAGQTDGGQSLLAAARVAKERGYRYDLLYIAIFAGELLHAQGREQEAQFVFNYSAAAPLADAFVRALVDVRGRAPLGGVTRRETSATDCVAFDRVAEWLVASMDIAEFSARLRTALV